MRQFFLISRKAVDRGVPTLRAVYVGNAAMPQFGQVLYCKVRSIPVIYHHGIVVSTAEKAVYEDVRFARKVESRVCSAHEGLDQNNPICCTADALVNCLIL